MSPRPHPQPPEPRPAVLQGPETFEATCTNCGRSWKGLGRQQSRRARRKAQQHADKTWHLIEAQHANH